ncbi:xylobiose transport system substrate-binding protein [Lipingzhangella halophila]|uniref:Xylobiose transport system substrate-binding protein n=1 Tax=Lipingzhangella halophila TaxID=1783352 RepID=A0A7W7RM82_9ACTN|nr:extracellular solute-binding protein [Lipingzhangella halophila]MBB4934551.1 xylobiose transport system substrate-binding protein [Lipingzhangella halophila]
MTTLRTGAAGSLALALTLTACSGGGDGQMHVYMYQDSLAVVQKDAVERFNEDADVEAVVDEVPGETYEDKVRTVMGSNNQPDVFFNWGGGNIRPYVEEDMLLSLDDMMENNPEFEESFIPSVLEEAQIDGVQYGVPMRGTQPVLLFYNEAVFEDVGAEPPETWEDLLGLVDTFNDEGITPFALGGADTWTMQMWLQYLVDRNGGPEVFQQIESGDPEGWRDPAMLQAAEGVEELVNRDAFGDNFSSVSFTEGAASTLLSEGDAAMHLMGSWEYSTHLDQAEEFAENDLGYAPFPEVSGGAGDPANVTGNPTNYFSVTADSEYTEEAQEFLKATAEEEYVRDMVENGEVPTTTDAEEYLDDSPNPDFARFQYELVQDAPHFQLSWDQSLDADVSEAMLNEIDKLFIGESTPDEFVDAMAEQQQ